MAPPTAHRYRMPFIPLALAAGLLSPSGEAQPTSAPPAVVQAELVKPRAGLGLVLRKLEAGGSVRSACQGETNMIAICTFEADITPPIGHPLCAGWYPPARGITDRLWAKGIVLTGEEKPVVLCALDWAELSNREHLRWRQALAAAAGTEPDRVAVQCTHAHNTPWPDREAQNLLDEAGFTNVIMAGAWCEQARDRVAAAVRDAMQTLRPCTHVATGQSRVDQVASTRRVMGSDGRVKAIRWTKIRDPAVRAEPEGLIDPFLKTISFWEGDRKRAVLHYYAVHNTSFDGDGLVTSDFAGLARQRRQQEDGDVPHLYFTGCGGNVTAGKYNDGDPANRPVLSERVFRAMAASEQDMRRTPLNAWTWRVQPVVLPPREDLDEARLGELLRAPDTAMANRSRAALMLSYLHRQDLPIPVTCLQLGADVCIVNLPGEAFIEYQLAAQQERPDAFVAVASYGDLGTGYITLERSFAEGGYEPIDAFVSGKSEAMLREAIRLVTQPLALAAGLLSSSGEAQPTSAPPARIVASCDFEGPYTMSGSNQIHKGFDNNWVWGKKDMQLRAEKDAGRPGTVQSIHLRGIASGAVQFISPTFTAKKDRYYRFTCWMKAQDLEGPVNIELGSKSSREWTLGERAWSGTLKPEWTAYSFSAKAMDDVDDMVVAWMSAGLGKFWIDDMTIEESDQPFAGKPLTAEPPEPGNLLPRSSCEGKRDYLWSTGVQGRPDAYWEDPQAYRAPDGKFGAYCLAIPASTHRGSTFTHSITLNVRPGAPYTFSAWARADRPDVKVNLEILQLPRGSQSVASQTFSIGPTWQRISITGTTAPSAKSQVILQIAPLATHTATVAFLDGFQLEAGATPTDYAPRFPLELYADIGQQGGNLLEWGQTVPLNLLVAAADKTALTQAKVEVVIVGYPDVVVWKKTLTLPVGQEQLLNLKLKRRGLMRVDMRTVDPTLASPQEMILATLPPPRPTGEASMFGTHISERPFFVDYVHKIGIKWTRNIFVTPWSSGEPERGKYRWYDEPVEGIRKGGLYILAQASINPPWAQLPKGSTNVIDVPAFEAYCEAATRHYRDKISHWEIWNEPYMSNVFFCGGNAKQFSEVAVAAARGMRRGNPNVKVLGLCTDLAQIYYAKDVTPEARACVDIWSLHYYPNNICGGGTLKFAGNLDEYRELLSPNPPKEYWNTEGGHGTVGWNSLYTFIPITREFNDWATAFGSRVWIEHAKAGLSKFFVYTAHQSDSMIFSGTDKQLIGFDRSPTPTAVAMAITAYAMDGLKNLPCPEIPGLLQGLFEGSGRATWVVYDDGGVLGRKHLNLKQLPKDAEVFDVMGNDPRLNGGKDWEIGIQPLFVMSKKQTAQELATTGIAAIRM